MLGLRSVRQLASALSAAGPAHGIPLQLSQLGPLASGSFQQQVCFASEAQEDALDEEWFEGEELGPAHREHIPIDRPRTLEDYNRLFYHLAQRRKGYLMRDVMEEMSLNGIRPNQRTYLTGMFAAMRSRKLGDAMYFWEEMQQHGVEPETEAYTAIISACGRCGQLGMAVEYKRQMLEKGLELSQRTYVALLSAFSEAGKLHNAQEVFEEMQQAGHVPDEDAYAALMSCYAHLKPGRTLPNDAEQQLLDLLAKAKERLADAPWGEEQGERLSSRRGPPGLLMYNALLKSLVTLGCHERAKEIFRCMRDEWGVPPDCSAYTNIIRSHLDKAVGKQSNLWGDKLTAAIDARLQNVDLTPFIRKAEAELHLGATSPDDHNVSEEEEDVEGTAQAQAGSNLSEEEDEIDAAPAADASARAVEPPRPLPQVPSDKHERYRTAVMAKAQNMARSRVRFDIMAEHVDLDAWYQALHLFQEVLDQGMLWGPDLAYAMVKTSIDLASAGVEDALEVAHTILDKFEEKRLFVDVENGTDLLLMAVRRDVNDLSVAHRIYDMLKKNGRNPRTTVSFKYMRAMCLREPHKFPERVRVVCNAILNDPDVSEATMRMKAEAHRRRSVFGGPRPKNLGKGS